MRRSVGLGIILAAALCLTTGGTAQTDDAEKKSLTIEPYGYFKLDVIRDDSKTNDADFPAWVLPGDTNDADMDVHARQTRLGFWFKGPDVGAAKSKARFEFDLTNGGSDTKYLPGIRHAYFLLDWGRVSLLAGQTSDIISPLVPNTVNYLVAWYGGDIGFRRPQLTVSFRHPIGETEFQTSVGVLRNVGQDFSAAGFSADGGEDSATVQVQGRFGLHGSLFERPAQIGVSGHYNREDYGGTLGDFDSYSIDGDLAVPLGAYFALSGEFFYGSNLDALLGGIGQGVNANTGEAIVSRGGWGQVQVTPVEWLEANLGMGIDDPKDGDLSNDMRSRNLYGFGNVAYIVSKLFRVAFEYSQWRTSYIAGATAVNNRYQLAFIYFLP